jgi:uncharacterized protein (DUF302 family)
MRGNILITKKSQFDVNDTLDRLETILNEKGIKPVARVDHAAAAKAVDMELRPTQVLFFGNPKLGTQLMQSDQLAGLELPMRILAWEAEDGSTWLGYHSPQTIVDSLNLQNVSDATNMMITAIDTLTEIAVKE